MKYLLGLALGLLLLSASVAKADGFNPADVYPGETVYDFTALETFPGFPPAAIRWTVEVLDVSPLGADFWGFCKGPNPLVAAPYCPTDDPIQAFEAAGSTFNIAVDIWGFDPGLTYPEWTTATLATPEPSTGGLLVAACFLCAFVALGRRMA